MSMQSYHLHTHKSNRFLACRVEGYICRDAPVNDVMLPFAVAATRASRPSKKYSIQSRKKTARRQVEASDSLGAGLLEIGTRIPSPGPKGRPEPRLSEVENPVGLGAEPRAVALFLRWIWGAMDLHVAHAAQSEEHQHYAA